MKRNTKKTLGLVSFPVFAATLASCASAYLGAEVPTVAPRNVEQMKGDRSVNLVLLCESPWDDPTLCDELNRAAQQGVLESGVFTNLSIAENVPRLEIAYETHVSTSTGMIVFPCVLWGIASGGLLGCTQTSEHTMSATFVPVGGSPLHRKYSQVTYLLWGLLPLNGSPPKSATYLGSPPPDYPKSVSKTVLKSLVANLALDLDREGALSKGSDATGLPPKAGAEQR